MNGNLQQAGKLIIIAGIILVGIGSLLYFSEKIPFLGKLPGDITIKKKNFTVYFPLATSILLSLIVSIIIYFLRRK